MDGPLGATVLLLLIIGACIQVAVALHHQYSKGPPDTEKDADLIATELELQLQGELHGAIKSSTPPLSTVDERLDNEQYSLLNPPLAPRVKFAHQLNNTNSWANFKTEAKRKLDRLAGVIKIKPRFGPIPSTNDINRLREELVDVGEVSTETENYQQAFLHLQLPLLVSSGSTEEERAILVNVKQYNRILKRRLTRQLIEEYFRSRPLVKSSHPRDHSLRGCMKRPRGPGGRFLTKEEIGLMQPARDAKFNEPVAV